jgi:photosystem II stability/assembly factor-like uncharacterized protein
MVDFRGVGYWLGKRGLLVSKDRGATWALIACPSGATLGPMFGRDSKHMAIGTPEGLFVTADGGKAWKLAAPLAPDIPILKGGKYGTYGWDPLHDLFYGSQMTKPAYRYEAKI